MDPYRLLLEELGIKDHNIEPDEIEVKPWYTQIEDSPCEFTCWDLPTDVPPDDYIQDEYFEEPLFHLDYSQEQDFEMNCIKKHRYSRKDRFRLTLYQLLGMNGEVPHSVIKLVKRSLPKKVKKNKIWNDIRAILKKHKLRRYYNRIPTLIKEISGLKPTGINSERINSILTYFFKFDFNFNEKFRREWSRKYFPNLRFIALKLVADVGIKYPYHVPLIRTTRKKKYLDNLFNEFMMTSCM